MKLSDLISCDSAAESEAAFSAETEARDALERMSEHDSDHVRIGNSGDDGTAVLSQRHIIRGILDEIESAQSELECVYGQLDEDLLGRFEIAADDGHHAISDHGKLANAVGRMSEGLIILDGQLHVEMINPSAKRLLGVLENATSEIASAVLDVIGIRNMIANGCNQGKVKNAARVKVSGQRVLQVRWTEMSDEGGNSGHVIMLNDATNEIAAEKVKTDFIAAISHELRTPVTSIQNSVSNILAGVTGRVNKKTRKYLEVMHGDCRRFADLISDLLDIAKLQAGSLPVNRKVINVVTTINEALSNFKKKANDKGLLLEFIDGGSVSPVFADSQRILQVLWNLLANAIEFTEPGGKISVSAYDENDHIVIYVADTGVGIQTERQRQIFDKFYQVNRQAGAGYKGTGLGLAICQGIVTMHGGSIWVESQRSSGSKFMFSIPKCDPVTALREHTEMLSEHCRRKGDGFALLVLNFKFPNGTDETKSGNVDLIMNDIILESTNFLTNKEDLVLKMSETDIIVVIRGAVKSRIPGVRDELRKIIANRLKKKFNTDEIMPMSGIAIYPSDTRLVADLGKIATGSLKELTDE